MSNEQEPVSVGNWTKVSILKKYF